MYYVKDTYRNRLDLYFDKIPSESIRNFLKNDGWHWNKAKKCWFTYLSQKHIETAVSLGAVPHKDQVLEKSTYKQIPYVPKVSYKRPVLDLLYSQPRFSKDIRMAPISEKEFKSYGLSSNVISEYLERVRSLYLSSSLSQYISLNLDELWRRLIAFCKDHQLIGNDFNEKILVDCITDNSENTFDEFRLFLERILTKTDPDVQFMKCMYGVDVMHFDWWQEFWDPIMCQLGRISYTTKEFTPLSRNELFALRRHIRQIKKENQESNAPLASFDSVYWEQIIIWNLEETTEEYSFDDHTLYIHKGRIVCQTRHHNIIQATAILSNIAGTDILLNVNYCTECKKFFMNYSTYQQYRKKYGIILGDLKMLKQEDFIGYEGCLAEESPLHLCGYTVSEKVGLTTTERQNIIAFVIEQGPMSKGEVISHLNWLIDTNSTREHMDTAISKWNADLSFTLRYDLENQKKVLIKDIAKYCPNQFTLT